MQTRNNFGSRNSRGLRSPRSEYEARSSQSTGSYDRSSSSGDRGGYSSTPRSTGGNGTYGRDRSNIRGNSQWGGSRPSFGGSRGGFGGGRSGGYSPAPRRTGRFNSQRIDERMFINKAAAETEIDNYTPKHTFADFNLNELLLTNLETKGLIKPSPIQDQSIPVILEGKDVIGIAATGTGKTAAFLVPMVQKVMAEKGQKVMILAPTRELALQVQKELFAIAKGSKLFSCAAVGGMPIYNQIRQLQLGVQFVVGTPGRVQDLIERGKIKMSEFQNIVLDEADRMLDMGFVDDMRAILGAMPEDKQGLFFSATFETKVKALCNTFLRDPVTVAVKTRDTSGSVEQDVVRVPRSAKKADHLHEILKDEGATKVLVFRQTKRSVDELHEDLIGRGVKSVGLHGDMRNFERNRAVDALSRGTVQVLIATDVAARGLDIKDISHVINFDLPNDYDTYVHRIGRTGRGQAKGIALTFVNA